MVGDHGNSSLKTLVAMGLISLLVLVAADTPTFASQDQNFFGRNAKQVQVKIKTWLYNELAEPMSKKGFKQAPVVTFWAGWDFSDRQWKLNEYTNQLGHSLVGTLSSSLFGRTSTMIIAVGVEVEQYFNADNRQLKLDDRLRDILFYLI